MERNFTSPSREGKKENVVDIFMLVVIGTNLSHNKWWIYSHLITSSHFLPSQTKEIQTCTRRNSYRYAFLTTFFVCNNVMSQARIRASKIWKRCPEIIFLRIKFASFFLQNLDGKLGRSFSFHTFSSRHIECFLILPCFLISPHSSFLTLSEVENKSNKQ